MSKVERLIKSLHDIYGTDLPEPTKTSFDRLCNEALSEYQALKAENERLREALEKISNSLAGDKDSVRMRQQAHQALGDSHE